MYGKSNMETYITICKTDSQRGNLLYGSGNSNRGRINPEGWDEDGDGREFKTEGIYVHLWLIHVEV